MLAAHLAVAANRSRFGRAAVLDLDPQGSLTDWWNAQEADHPALAEVGAGGLRQALAEVEAAGYGLAVIDCPPAFTGTIGTALAAAHLLLIPVQPSSTDPRAVGTTVDLAVATGIPFVFVLNRAIRNSKLARQAPAVLMAHGPVVGQTVHQRVDFAAAMAAGRTALELRPNGDAATEIWALWRYVEAYLLKAEAAQRRVSAGHRRPSREPAAAAGQGHAEAQG